MIVECAMRPLVWNFLLLLVASILLVPVDSHPYIIWEMLSYPQSAKSAAFGGAVSSLPGDYTAMVYNPATLGFCRYVEIYGTYSGHEVMYGPEHYFFGGAIYPTKTLGTFGADLTYRLSAEMTWVDP